MDRHQRTRARGLDRLARAMQVEQVAHPVRTHGGHCTRCAVALRCATALRQQAAVATVARTDEECGIGP